MSTRIRQRFAVNFLALLTSPPSNEGLQQVSNFEAPNRLATALTLTLFRTSFLELPLKTDLFEVTLFIHLCQRLTLQDVLSSD